MFDTSNQSPLSKDFKNGFKLKNGDVSILILSIRNQLILGATIFSGRLIFEDLRYIYFESRGGVGSSFQRKNDECEFLTCLNLAT